MTLLWRWDEIRMQNLCEFVKMYDHYIRELKLIWNIRTPTKFLYILGSWTRWQKGVIAARSCMREHRDLSTSDSSSSNKSGESPSDQSALAFACNKKEVISRCPRRHATNKAVLPVSVLCSMLARASIRVWTLGEFKVEENHRCDVLMRGFP